MTEHDHKALLDVLDAIDDINTAATFLRRMARRDDTSSLDMAKACVSDAARSLDGARYHIEKIEERIDP